MFGMVIARHFMLAGSLLAAAAAQAAPFMMHVVDSATGRGTPLVELLVDGAPALITDSNGYIAIDDPALVDRTLSAGLRSYGYSQWAGAVTTTSGQSLEIALDRHNRAERLYRVTGPLIYEDSLLAGIAAPIARPLHNANVKGQDSVQTAIYKGQIYWFWGDTLYEQGFGNFRTAGARSMLPGQGGLDPSLGVDLEYFVDTSGSARQMMPLTEPGPVWMDGVFTLNDGFGQERLLAHYSRMRDLGTVLEHGLALFNDATQTFQRYTPFDLQAPVVPRGHAFRHTDDGVEYVYFAEDYPNVRVRADWAHMTDPDQWEAFTPLLPNSRYDPADPPLETDDHGNLVFGWKKGADPFTSAMLDALVQGGRLDRDDSPFRLQDHASGREVRLHRASVHWNEYCRNWIMIGTEQFGDSLLGEVWFSEAPTPEGPWADAVKVTTHDRGASGDYTFYNPTSHPFFDQDGGRLIYFEGTYANTFSGNSTPTPLYDYNQIMYRLDLATIDALAPLGGDYNRDGLVDGADFLNWQQSLGAVVAHFDGADGDGDGGVDIGDLESWRLRWAVSESWRGARDSAATPEPGAILLAVSAMLTLGWRRFPAHRLRA
jgi:hypothetical protein